MMMHALLQRLRKAGAPASGGTGTGASATTVVREERGSGTGAVLFQPYRVSEVVAGDDQTEAEAPSASAPSPSASSPSASSPLGGPRTPNPVADQWRRSSPAVFRSVAHRFCARAPKVAEELRTLCLSGQREKLAHLAEALKPTLSLFDMSAADAADRVKQAASDGESLLAYEVLGLEHEVWRVQAAWQRLEQPGADVLMEVAP